MDDNMNYEQIKQLYIYMYDCMIKKDEDGLSKIIDHSFTLTHMTGFKQNKIEYINSILEGKLNYFKAVHEDISIKIDKNKATVVGKSNVTASVFGGGINTWQLKQILDLALVEGKWIIKKSIASTY